MFVPEYLILVIFLAEFLPGMVVALISNITHRESPIASFWRYPPGKTRNQGMIFTFAGVSIVLHFKYSLCCSIARMVVGALTLEIGDMHFFNPYFSGYLPICTGGYRWPGYPG